MANERQLIDLNDVFPNNMMPVITGDPWLTFKKLVDRISNAPTVDAVEAEKYNELREAFVDFVCSGVHNPAPYCKNRCAECVDNYGWCTYRRCNGFNPDGERRTDQ